MYVPQVQEPISRLTLVVRSNSAPGGLIRAVTAKISEMDPDLPLSNIQSMEAIVAGSVAQPRLTAQFTGLFAALALVLAAIGIYGVMAYSVTQRRHELGIRVALGAQPRDILTLVVGQGMRLVVAGAVAGIAASLALTRLMQTLLFGTSARDPFALGGATIVLVIVALAACYVPARRAARVDPIIALRHE
jgi:putative ABC transport system permease protein